MLASHTSILNHIEDGFLKRILVTVLAAALTVSPAMTNALPQGGEVVAGSADIVDTSDVRMDINQHSDKAVLNWDSFGSATNEHINFNQPSASSAALNRVVGTDPSQLLGKLTANGQVMLVNPNGVFFGHEATVDVAGLVATTSDIRTEDFMAGNYNFNITSDNPNASVINNGEINITAAESGIAAFVSPFVRNNGIINARLGKVTLAGTDKFTLDLYGDELIQFALEDEVAEQVLVAQNGTIDAEGGRIAITAGAAEEMVDSLINMDGITKAQSVAESEGVIKIRGAGDINMTADSKVDVSGQNGADGGEATAIADNALRFEGDVNASGSATGGDGGYIELTGDRIMINGVTNAGAPMGKGGTTLLDPSFLIVVDVADELDEVAASTIEGDLSAGTDFVLEASNKISVWAEINTSGDTNSANLHFSDEDANNDLEVVLARSIILGNNQTLTGDATEVLVREQEALLQNAIDIAVSGADVNIDPTLSYRNHDAANPLTFVLDSTLMVDKQINLLGNGPTREHVLIDASGIGNARAIQVEANGATFENFTLTGSSTDGSTAYGFKIQPDTTVATDTIEDIEIRNVTVQGSGRSEIDINGGRNITIDNVTVDGQGTGGVGIAVTDSRDLNFSNITTLGNTWGGLGIWAFGKFYTGGINDYSLTGTNSFGESVPAYLSAGNGFTLADITNLYVPDFSHVVQFNGSDTYAQLHLTEQTAIDNGVLADANTAVVETLTHTGGVSDGENNYIVGYNTGNTDNLKIQSAIDFADTDANINVRAGTYNETVNVNKLVNLYGAGSRNSVGAGNATVIAPTSGRGIDASAQTVSGFDGFTVQGFDIVMSDASIALQSNSAINNGFDGSNYTYEDLFIDMNGFEQTAIGLFDVNGVTLNDVEVVNSGRTDGGAIEMVGVAGFEMNGGRLADNVLGVKIFDVAGYESNGTLMFDDVDFENNSDRAVWVSDVTGLDIENSTITGSADAIRAETVTGDVNVLENNIVGTGAAGTYGVYLDGVTGKATIKNNRAKFGGAINDFETGIYAANSNDIEVTKNLLQSVEVGVEADTVNQVVVKRNEFFGNSTIGADFTDVGQVRFFLNELDNFDTGLRFAGTTSVNDNQFYGNTLTNITGQFIDNQSVNGFSARGADNTFNGIAGNTTDLAEGFQLEDKITHAMDGTAGKGLVEFGRTDTVYVTTNTAGIQRGVDVASANNTVEVQAGTYNEEVEIDKSLTLRGANAGKVYNDATRGAESELYASGINVRPLQVTDGDVVIDGMKISHGTGKKHSVDVKGDTDSFVFKNSILDRFSAPGGLDRDKGVRVSAGTTAEVRDSQIIAGNVGLSGSGLDADVIGNDINMGTPGVNSEAVWASGINSLDVENNTLTGLNGVKAVNGVGDVNVLNNVMNGTDGDESIGVYLDGVTGLAKVDNNTSIDDFATGVKGTDNNNLEVTNNVISGVEYGIEAADNDTLLIQGNTITGNSTVGIALEYQDGGTVNDNQLFNFDTGLKLGELVQNVDITDNQFYAPAESEESVGIYALDGSENITVSNGNTFTGGWDYGIAMYSAAGLTVEDNLFDGNGVAIGLNVPDATLLDNTFTNNGIALEVLNDSESIEPELFGDEVEGSFGDIENPQVTMEGNDFAASNETYVDLKTDIVIDGTDNLYAGKLPIDMTLEEYAAAEEKLDHGPDGAPFDGLVELLPSELLVALLEQDSRRLVNIITMALAQGLLGGDIDFASLIEPAAGEDPTQVLGFSTLAVVQYFIMTGYIVDEEEAIEALMLASAVDTGTVN